MRQYESFQNESPHSSVFSSSAYSLRIRRAVALDRVGELHEVRGWFRSEQDVYVVVLAVEVRQFNTVVVREPADDLVYGLGSFLS